MVWRGWALVAGLLPIGCSVDVDSGGDEDIAADETLMDMNFPPAACMEDTADADDCIEPVDACSVSAECPGAQVCVASFDGDIGSLRCDTLCVLDLDDASWCSDDAACCSAGATCVRGLCMPSDGDTDASSGGTDSDASTTDAGTSTSTGTGG